LPIKKEEKTETDTNREQEASQDITAWKNFYFHLDKANPDRDDRVKFTFKDDKNRIQKPVAVDYS
jgi:hypothetical protein